jgi:hypothetical protein
MITRRSIRPKQAIARAIGRRRCLAPMMTYRSSPVPGTDDDLWHRRRLVATISMPVTAAVGLPVRGDASVFTLVDPFADEPDVMLVT